jgi:hypothetical protein
LSEFDPQQHVMLAPCGHYYHAACLRGWLARDCTCPLCKQLVSVTGQQQRGQVGGESEGLQNIVVEGR